MPYLELEWRQGAPFNTDFDDVYHSSEGSVEESRYVFLHGNDLPARFAALLPGRGFILAETGFGTGLNFIITVAAFLEHAPADTSLDFISVEKDLVHPDDVRKLASELPELLPLYEHLLEQYPEPVEGICRLHLFDNRVRLTLLVGDVFDMLQSLPQQTSVDAWYLDGFAPSANPRMWSEAVLQQVARLSHVNTSLSTYTIAGDVRRGLQAVGFDVGRRDGYGKKRDMMVASLTAPPTLNTSLPWFAVQHTDSKPVTVAVIGAGIAGLMTALQLVRRGYRVTLVDKHAVVASGASGNPAGLVMPRYSVNDDLDNAFQVQALLYAISQYRLIQQSSEDNVWFDEPVDCALQSTRVESLFKDRLFAQISASSERTQPLEGKLWFRYQHSGWLRPSALCASIYNLCRQLVDFKQAQASRIERRSNTWCVFDFDNNLITQCDSLVLANAAGIVGIEGMLELPLSWNLGQVTSVEVDGDAAKSPLAAGAYSSPVYQGRMTTGATYRHDLDNDAVMAEDHEFNLAGLKALQPGVIPNESTMQGRVSQRANLPDRIPMAGAVPDADFYLQEYADLRHGRAESRYRNAQYLPGLYINIGHGSRGFTTAPLCAEIVASMIDNTPLPVSEDVLRHLHPARFMVRDLKRQA